MSYQQCICNLCAKSVELPITLFTPGEATEPCFTCDKCRRYDGDYSKPTQERRSCGLYQRPAKLLGLKQRRADQRAKERRQNFRVIQGGRLHEQ